MSTPSQEFVMIVEESAYLTPATSPTVWTQATTYGLANAAAYYMRLAGSNQFSMRARPSGIVRVPYGGGLATDAFAICDKIECKGQLTVPLSISQAPFLLSWAGVPISGGTAPWATTQPNGDLASCAIYHGIVEFDGTIKRRVYLGCKVDAWTVTCSESATMAQLQLQISGSTPQGNQFDSSTDPTSGTFPVPTDAQLPIDPFEWIHTGGIITLGGASRAAITELNVTVNNTLARSWYNNRFVQYLSFKGRKTTVAAKVQYVAQGDTDRTHYEAVASESMSIGFNNGTHGFVLNLHAQNIFDPLEDDLSLGNTYWQSSTSHNMYDSAAGTDLGLTFS